MEILKTAYLLYLWLHLFSFKSLQNEIVSEFGKCVSQHTKCQVTETNCWIRATQYAGTVF